MGVWFGIAASNELTFIERRLFTREDHHTRARLGKQEPLLS